MIFIIIFSFCPPETVGIFSLPRIFRPDGHTLSRGGEAMKTDIGGGAARWLSRLAVLAAALLLVQVCRICRPAARVIDWDALEGYGARARQAFSQLAGALQNGENAAEAFAESYRAWTDAAD